MWGEGEGPGPGARAGHRGAAGVEETLPRLKDVKTTVVKDTITLLAFIHEIKLKVTDD